MFQELAANQFETIRPLLGSIGHLLSATAVVEGTSPGRIWVDWPDHPSLALLRTPEGHMLAGDLPGSDCAASLKQLLVEQLYPRAREEGWWYFHFELPDQSWQALLSDVLGVPCPVWIAREYYVMRSPKTDWRADLPDGFEIRRVDRALLDGDSASVERIRGWGEGSFGSLDAFLERGFGFCVTRGDEIVSWCISDCVSGDRCEIGIHTAEPYRRRGLATCAAAATVEHCLQNGLTHIGWHCDKVNVASAATARAAGFEKERDYPAVQAWLNEVDSLLANGHISQLEGRWAEAADCFERALAQLDARTADALSSHIATGSDDIARYRQRAACVRALAEGTRPVDTPPPRT